VGEFHVFIHICVNVFIIYMAYLTGGGTTHLCGAVQCAGLTMRGSAYLVLDTVANAHATRRELVETVSERAWPCKIHTVCICRAYLTGRRFWQLNFPPTLAFTKSSTVATYQAPYMS
jgi:hypothetical protein